MVRRQRRHVPRFLLRQARETRRGGWTRTAESYLRTVRGTDDYRQRSYHGGILSHGFLGHWRNSLHRPRYRSLHREMFGDDAYQLALQAAREDEEVMAVPVLREALAHPEEGPALDRRCAEPAGRSFLARARCQRRAGRDTRLPRRLLGQLRPAPAGCFRRVEEVGGPKRMVIGPGVY